MSGCVGRREHTTVGGGAVRSFGGLCKQYNYEDIRSCSLGDSVSTPACCMYVQKSRRRSSLSYRTYAYVACAALRCSLSLVCSLFAMYTKVVSFRKKKQGKLQAVDWVYILTSTYL